VLLESAAADDANRTRVEIVAAAAVIRATHSNPAGDAAAYVEGTITGGLVMGRVYRWLVVRDDDAGIEAQNLAVYQWVDGAWARISGSRTNAFETHNGVPTELRVGNSRTEDAAAWGAYELVAVKGAYDPAWNPTDAEAVADSSWCACYRNGGLDADKTSGGDSAAATNTNFVAVTLTAPAMWQNRDGSGLNLSLLGVLPPGLGINTGAVCFDVVPLMLPAAWRDIALLDGPSTQFFWAGHKNTAKIELRFRDSTAVYYYCLGNSVVLALGVRVRVQCIYLPNEIYLGVNGVLADVTRSGTKGLRTLRAGTIQIPAKNLASQPFAGISSRLCVYDKVNADNRWCRAEMNFARSLRA